MIHAGFSTVALKDCLGFMPKPTAARMNQPIRKFFMLTAVLALGACGGGGGGGSSSQGPAITFTGSAVSVDAGGSVTLTWSATEATSCTALGSWSGSRAVSGTEQVGPVGADASFTLQCANGNGSTSRTVNVDVIPRPAPVVDISAAPSVLSAGGSSTVSWAAQNATSCSATGALSGPQATSGTVVLGTVSTATNVALTCVGNGQQSFGQATIGIVDAGKVSVSGKITFDRVPFKAVGGAGLDPNSSIQSPAREVVVEAIEGVSIVASTVTDYLGNYTLQVPQNANVFVRAKAQMLRSATPTWNFRVLNNRNSNALYVLDGTIFNVGIADVRDKNLHASSGWAGVAYTNTRAAAPFAILDTMYRSKQLVRSANAGISFPPLAAFWSTENRPSSTFCPSDGNVVSSLYVVFSANDIDECATPVLGNTGIYILGSFQAGDTDEFDPHVIAHEFGHYFEDRFSRSDSIGGNHGSGDRLDLRVAFGEGWGNAFGAMVLNDPVYRDSSSGMNLDTGFNIESSTVTAPGWFSEFSLHKLLWDLFDEANEAGDTVSLGFLSIYDVMTGGQPSTDALTSVFPFARALKANNPSISGPVNDLLSQQGVNSITDDFGVSETSFAPSQNVIPIYTDISIGAQVSLCGIRTYGEYNKLSNRRFLRFQSSASRTIAISVSATTGGTTADPDIVVWRQGDIVGLGEDVGTTEVLQVPVQVGTYVIEIYDYNHIDQDTGTGGASTCMNVSIAG